MNLLDSFISAQDSIKDGLISHSNYSFLFLDYIKFDISGSYYLTEAGAYWGVMDRFLISEIKDRDHYLDDVRIDLLFAGSLKNILPDIEFGGFERIFDALIIVKTPSDTVFPFMFYFGASGTALGAWDSINANIIVKAFSNNSNRLKIINPFKLSKSKIRNLLDALEGALRKVPAMEFEVIYENDSGKFTIG